MLWINNNETDRQMHELFVLLSPSLPLSLFFYFLAEAIIHL